MPSNREKQVTRRYGCEKRFNIDLTCVFVERLTMNLLNPNQLPASVSRV